MTENKIAKFVKAVNIEFREPFVKKGLVRCRIFDDHKGFNLKIAGRDVSFDENLNVTGAGTMLDDGCEI